MPMCKFLKHYLLIYMYLRENLRTIQDRLLFGTQGASVLPWPEIKSSADPGAFVRESSTSSHGKHWPRVSEPCTKDKDKDKDAEAVTEGEGGG